MKMHNYIKYTTVGLLVALLVSFFGFLFVRGSYLWVTIAFSGPALSAAYFAARGSISALSRYEFAIVALAALAVTNPLTYAVGSFLWWLVTIVASLGTVYLVVSTDMASLSHVQDV
jgi:hypothetical protein